MICPKMYLVPIKQQMIGMKFSVHLTVCLFSLFRTVLADHHVLVADTPAIITLFAPEWIIMFENL